MKHSILAFTVLTLISVAVAAPPPLPLIYKPAKSNAAATRIGGGTRGIKVADASGITVLAPPHTAVTSQTAPVLYWFLSGSSGFPVEIAMSVDNVSEPVFEKNLGRLDKPGLQSINLADFGVQLKPGQEYRWSVAVITDAGQRSGDLLASAMIKLEMPKQPLTNVAEMAASGYWYDALDLLVKDHSPQLKDFLKQGDIDLPDLK
jgi:hypothetical protein